MKTITFIADAIENKELFNNKLNKIECCVSFFRLRSYIIY